MIGFVMCGKPRFSGERGEKIRLNELCSKGSSSLRQKDVSNDGPYAVYGASGLVGTMGSFQNSVPYVAVIKDGAGVGRASACEANTSVLGTMQALIPSKGVNRDYLLHLVRSLHLGDGFSGSTIPHIYFKDYGKLPVPFHSPAEQQRIVDNLSAVEQQIEVSKQQLAELDSLVKSRFNEVFGPYIDEDKQMALSRFCELVTVGIANAATHAYADDGIVMLRNLNVRENQLDDSDLIRIRPDFAAKYGKKALKAGDVLVTRTGYPGIACVVPERYAGCQTFTTLIARLKSNAPITPLFLSHWINSPKGKEFVARMKAGSSQQNFGASSLKLLPVPLPPLVLQQQFAVFVQQVDKLRFMLLGTLRLYIAAVHFVAQQKVAMAGLF